jgi:uncharacterized damage-inducible protein DinB
MKMNSKPESEKDIIFWDLERELAVTRKVLEHLPPEHYGWKPHEKSMSLGQLALHVATLPDWVRTSIGQDTLDAATAPRPPSQIKTRQELLDIFDRNVTALREAVGRFDAAKIGDMWSFRRGEQIMTSQPRATVYRIWCLNHMIHHRGQLCVYLRLLNVPVPTVYFNSADDPTWVFA